MLPKNQRLKAPQPVKRFCGPGWVRNLVSPFSPITRDWSESFRYDSWNVRNLFLLEVGEVEICQICSCCHSRRYVLIWFMICKLLSTTVQNPRSSRANSTPRTRRQQNHVEPWWIFHNTFVSKVILQFFLCHQYVLLLSSDAACLHPIFLPLDLPCCHGIFLPLDLPCYHGNICGPFWVALL